MNLEHEQQHPGWLRLWTAFVLTDGRETGWHLLWACFWMDVACVAALMLEGWRGLDT